MEGSAPGRDTAACVKRADESVFAEFSLAELDSGYERRHGVTLLPEGCKEVVGVLDDWVFFVSITDKVQRLERVYYNGQNRMVLVGAR